jgi:DNA-directed RNA polymerase II subunit RPB2
MDLNTAIIPEPYVKVDERLNPDIIPTISNTTISNVKVDEDGTLLASALRFKGLTKTLTEIFDNWVTHILPRQVETRTVNVGEYYVSFGEVFIDKPKRERLSKVENLLPDECRKSDLNYTADLQASIIVTRVDTVDDELVETVSKSPIITISKIPVMVGSVLCHTHGKTEKEIFDMGEGPEDPRGYFIVKGREKNVLLQENLRPNRPYVFANSKGEVDVSLTSVTLTESVIFSIKLERYNLMYLEMSLLREKYASGTKKKATMIPVMSIFSLFGEQELNLEEMISYLMMFVADEKNVPKVYQIIYANMVYAMEKLEETEVMINDSVFGNEEYGTVSLLSEEASERVFSLEDLFNSMMPHMANESMSKKMDLVSMMIVRLAEYACGCRPLDNKDDWGNKKLESGGRLMEQLFNSLWRKFTGELKVALERTSGNIIPERVASLLPRDAITNEFVEAFTPNAWGVKPSKTTNYKGFMKANVTDYLKRDSLIYTYSHLLRINTPVSRKGKLSHLRVLQGTQLGFVCPVETPEGDTCGIVKSMAVSCRLSTENDTKTELVYSVVTDKNIPLMESRYIANEDGSDVAQENNYTEYESKVLFNGKFLGWTNGQLALKYLRKQRRLNIIPHDTSIVLEKDNILYVYTDGSRVTRPLLVVEDGRIVVDTKKVTVKGNDKQLTLREARLPFADLIREGAIEYIDASEQSSINLAQSPKDITAHHDMIRRATEEVQYHNENGNTTMADQAQQALNKLIKKRYDYCEIDPNAMFGVSASLMPLPNHNQAPRNVYQAQMGKQAIGIYHSNFENRFDPSLKVLAYPQRPLFETQLNDIVGLTKIPNGQMVTVAFMVFNGYNQEDAIIFNKGSIDRGLFHYYKLYRYTSTIKNATGKTPDQFMIPPKARVDMKTNAFSKINPETALPDVGTYIEEGDVVIPKVKMIINSDGTTTYHDISIRAAEGENGFVRRVFRGFNYEGKMVVKVRIAQLRQPTIGDKFASRYAQKGTIGLIMNEEDMPFVVAGPNKGRRPDLIVNPLSIPSRMTLGKLMEIVASKAATIKGERVNASAFKSFKIDDFRDTLKQYGFNQFGYETMASGMTGYMLGDQDADGYMSRTSAQIFMGPCFYQMLPHHVIDKITVRGTEGGVDPITHQPVGGRGDGAGRSGEMERDAMLSHGASGVLRDRFCVSSDGFYAVMCNVCNTIGSVVRDTKTYECRKCKQIGNFSKVQYPYSTKYLQHMLAALGFNTRLALRTNERSRYVKKALSTKVSYQSDDEDGDDEEKEKIQEQNAEEQEEEEILLKESEYDEENYDNIDAE